VERLKIRSSEDSDEEGDVTFTFRGRATYEGPREGDDGG
jgi:hypothetical protein